MVPLVEKGLSQEAANEINGKDSKERELTNCSQKGQTK